MLNTNRPSVHQRPRKVERYATDDSDNEEARSSFPRNPQNTTNAFGEMTFLSFATFGFVTLVVLVGFVLIMIDNTEHQFLIKNRPAYEPGQRAKKILEESRIRRETPAEDKPRVRNFRQDNSQSDYAQQVRNAYVERRNQIISDQMHNNLAKEGEVAEQAPPADAFPNQEAAPAEPEPQAPEVQAPEPPAPDQSPPPPPPAPEQAEATSHGQTLNELRKQLASLNDRIAILTLENTEAPSQAPAVSSKDAELQMLKDTLLDLQLKSKQVEDLLKQTQQQPV